MKKELYQALVKSLPIPIELIRRRIHFIREQEVMLDYELAELYQVTTGNLNLAVRRNTNRFPRDFMFPLTKDESEGLLLQIARPKTGRGGRHTPPHAFTEHGVAMLSSVLKSENAVQMNILIIRAFIQVRNMIITNKGLGRRLQKLEGTQKFHGKVLAGVVDDIKKIKTSPKTNAIGFRLE